MGFLAESHGTMYDPSRKSDYEMASRALQSSNSTVREQAAKAMYLIRNESKEITAMRQELVKAHRSNDKEKIKEIHWEVDHNPSTYKNEIAKNKLRPKVGEKAWIFNRSEEEVTGSPNNGRYNI